MTAASTPPRGTRWFHGDVSERPNFRDQRWDRDRSTSSLNDNGPGLYFTSHFREAATYGPYVYEGVPRSSFKLLLARKPTLAALSRMFELADDEDKERFLTDWDVRRPADALRRYAKRDTLFGALLGLYGDLIRDPAVWVDAMVQLGFDGTVVPRMYDRWHLVVWNVDRLTYYEVQEEQDV